MNHRLPDDVGAIARAIADARDRGRYSDRERLRALVDTCIRYVEPHSAKPRKLVVTLVVRLVPVAQRSRYHEEFLGEMVELPPREQCGYALRVLARAWKLRRELVEAPRHSER
ncbi:MAG: hypothetical protein ACRDS1_15185 [Pseudonocardiaceae bacterium]